MKEDQFKHHPSPCVPRRKLKRLVARGSLPASPQPPTCGVLRHHDGTGGAPRAVTRAAAHRPLAGTISAHKFRRGSRSFSDIGRQALLCYSKAKWCKLIRLLVSVQNFQPRIPRRMPKLSIADSRAVGCCPPMSKLKPLQYPFFPPSGRLINFSQFVCSESNRQSSLCSLARV